MYSSTIHILGDLDFDLSRWLVVRCDGVVALPTYDFLLVLVVTYGLSRTITKYNFSKPE